MRTLLRRSLCATLVLAAMSCSVARKADRSAPSPSPTVIVPTVVAPPAVPGRDGSAGLDGPNACTALADAGLSIPVRARPRSWNDAGLPALDLCALLIGSREVRVGISALPAQPAALSRLGTTLGTATPEALPELSSDAVLGPAGVAFSLTDRVVRITAAQGLSRAEALELGRAALRVVLHVVRRAWLADAACQPAGSTAERFLGMSAQLRRDYRTESGDLTCIWGSFNATVAIVETTKDQSIPEARRSPAPRRAPIGQPGYYLPDEGELVFRRGSHVVRVTALSDPPRPISLETLMDIVEPVMPLFIR